jgi:DNA repair photolyase
VALGGRNNATGKVVPIHEARKGRGAVSHIAHRFESREREPDGDALDAARAEREDGDDELPPLQTEVTFEQAGSVLAYNESPDLGFDRSINPYRGCEHGCPYCYARPTHSYLNLSPGLDFETRLVAKRNAAEVLERELAAPAYRPALVNLGSATDAYQPIERELRISRALVEVLARTRHPFTIVTKSALVERDLDLIGPAAAQGLAAVFFSLTTLDHALSRKLEPRAASPQRRLRAIRTMAQAGVPVHVNLAPVIPFINEPEIEVLLEAAAAAGARFAHYAVVRLPWEVNPIFQEWLQTHFPDRMQRVLNRVRDMRGGKEYDARFGVRMKGEGLWADLIRQRFEKGLARYGLQRNGTSLRTDLFEPPRAATPQLDLF